MEIIKDFIPVGHQNRPGYSMQPEYITVHNTANYAAGAGALNHAIYLKNPATKESWHFTVDDKHVVQHLPLTENGWHAGDGSNGTGNRDSIGIEVCVNPDSDFPAAVSKAVELIQYLMAQQSIPLERVVPHRHWSGKDCPHEILPFWDDFIGQIGGPPHNAPPDSQTEYVVQPGDTLWGIARRFDLLLDALLVANPEISDPGMIYPGEHLRIPQVADPSLIYPGQKVNIPR